MGKHTSRKPRALRGVDSKSLRIASRFWRNVAFAGDGCWTWSGVRTEAGYGKFRVNGQLLYASRFAWIATHGIIPDEIIVCHRCDNPPCCRPDHLFLGTYSANVRDRAAKDRQDGPQQPRILSERTSRFLSPDERRQIIALHEGGNYSERCLAQIYHVSRNTIHRCLKLERDTTPAGRRVCIVPRATGPARASSRGGEIERRAVARAS